MSDFRHVHFAGKPRSIAPVQRPRGVPRGTSRDEGAEPKAALDPFIEGLMELAGLSAEAYRPHALNRRLPVCVRLLREKDGEGALAKIRRQPELVPKVLSTLLLGVTEFYRDRHVFRAIGEKVLPDLLLRMPKVRIWSAACSDGQELYSVAILLSQLGGFERASLLGTDCRSEAIVRARRGCYAGPSPDLGLDADARWFRHRPTGYEVEDCIRRQIRWEVRDLLKDSPAGPWDLILWRNMSIYLNPARAGDLWRRMAMSLRPGGYLVVGKAERPPSEMPLRRIGACIYQSLITSDSVIA